MSLGAFRKLPTNKRLTNINDKGRMCRGASGASLIPVGTYLMPLEWNENNFYTLSWFENLNTPLL
jgi:hypothetical protein